VLQIGIDIENYFMEDFSVRRVDQFVDGKLAAGECVVLQNVLSLRENVNISSVALTMLLSLVRFACAPTPIEA
jgi:hypothetical protein